MYDERSRATEWWDNKNYYGLDMTVLHERAITEKFSQPILDTLKPECLLSFAPRRKVFNFETCTVEDLKYLKMEFDHMMTRTALLHGYVLYFSAFFDGIDKQAALHTGPNHEATHWYQTLLFFAEPVGVNRG